MRMSSSTGSDVGHGTETAVSREYTGRFPFAGTLHELVIDLDPTRSERERQELAQAQLDSEMTKQ